MKRIVLILIIGIVLAMSIHLILLSAGSNKSSVVFEKTNWKENKKHGISTLYLIFYLEGNHDKRLSSIYDETVVDYSPKALVMAKQHEKQYSDIDFHVVYCIKNRKNANSCGVTGFSIEQLEKIANMPRKEAIEEASKHAWSLQDVENKNILTN